MNKDIETVYYPPFEEKINVVSHAIGLVLSIVALVFLVLRANEIEGWRYMFSYIVYGLSLIVLYSASTFYHNSKEDKIRNRLNIFDHSSIYVLIAGTYTPFALVTLNGTNGWIVFSIVWGLAIAGIILKFFFIGRFNILSTVMYVAMGWLIVFDIVTLMDNLSSEGLLWMLIGGISYTVGAVLYSIKSINYNHAIFHVFVLIGSIAHFISIYFYVSPS